MEKIMLEHSTVVLIAHNAGDCMGDVCSLHKRSDHLMRGFEQSWRSDRGIMERICIHGVGHPDPDDYKCMNDEYERVHGCDGCCMGDK
jgi:hypothetical protein